LNCDDLFKALDFIVDRSKQQEELLLFGLRLAKPTMEKPLHDLFIFTIEGHHKHLEDYVGALKELLLAPPEDQQKDFVGLPWDVRPT
jgi:hypothetical protein